MSATDPADATAPVLDDLRARQRQAIETSGWGERFRLVQPRNPMFWLLVWAAFSGVSRTVQFFAAGAGNHAGALTAGVIVFALYTIPWLLFLHAHDRYTPESPKLLATGFFWGCFVATFLIAITVNGAVLSLYAKLFGQRWATDWAAGFTAPFTEETAKALGFLVLLGLAPRLIRSAYDAFVIGAFIGLGFQVSEDVLYAYQGAFRSFGTDQTAAALQVAAVRIAAGLTSHALFSAIFCTGLYWVLGRGGEGRQLGRGLLAMGFAMLAHGVWDVMGALGQLLLGGAGVALLPLLVAAVEITVIVQVARLASGTERTWMHDLLAPEVAAGTLTPAEVDAIASPRRAQRRHVKAVGGHHARKVERHVLEAGHDLAEAIARDHGEDTPTVAHARAEVTRLRTP